MAAAAAAAATAAAESALLPERLTSLSSFDAERVLSDGAEGGTVNVLGRWGDMPLLLKLARLPLPSGRDGLAALLAKLRLEQRMPYSGAEYGYYVDEDAGVSLDVLAPHAVASLPAGSADALLRRHVERATAVPQLLVRETAALYAAAHAPFVEALPPGALTWVHRILAKEKEVERLLLDAPGQFLLNTDPKWSTHPEPSGLYCLALVHQRDLASLRSLRGEHLPLLRALREQCLAAIQARYGLAPGAVRAFFHYPPQFYHLHVHFTALSVAIGAGHFVERAHLLDDVIENLERDGEHYARASITVRLGEGDALQQRYVTAAESLGEGEGGAKKARLAED